MTHSRITFWTNSYTEYDSQISIFSITCRVHPSIPTWHEEFLYWSESSIWHVKDWTLLDIVTIIMSWLEISQDHVRLLKINQYDERSDTSSFPMGYTIARLEEPCILFGHAVVCSMFSVFLLWHWVLLFLTMLPLDSLTRWRLVFVQGAARVDTSSSFLHLIFWFAMCPVKSDRMWGISLLEMRTVLPIMWSDYVWMCSNMTTSSCSGRNPCHL